MITNAMNKCPAGTRTALVTGANKGIGFFIALQLGLSGQFANILIGCRDATRGQEAVATLQQQMNNTSNTDVSVSFVPLCLGDRTTYTAVKETLQQEFNGKLHVLINNAGVYTRTKRQPQSPVTVNYRETVALTNELLPLLPTGEDARIVTVASQLGSLHQITSTSLRSQFESNALTLSALNDLMDQYENDKRHGKAGSNGWGSTEYGMSKLAIIAATRVWARDNPGIAINAACPGYCKTDMTGGMGMRDPQDGAKNVVIPATMDDPPTGQLYADYEIANW